MPCGARLFGAVTCTVGWFSAFVHRWAWPAPFSRERATHFLHWSSCWALWLLFSLSNSRCIMAMAVCMSAVLAWSAPARVMARMAAVLSAGSVIVSQARRRSGVAAWSVRMRWNFAKYSLACCLWSGSLLALLATLALCTRPNKARMVFQSLPTMPCPPMTFRVSGLSRGWSRSGFVRSLGVVALPVCFGPSAWLSPASFAQCSRVRFHVAQLRANCSLSCSMPSRRTYLLTAPATLWLGWLLLG